MNGSMYAHRARLRRRWTYEHDANTTQIAVTADPTAMPTAAPVLRRDRLIDCAEVGVGEEMLELVATVGGVVGDVVEKGVEGVKSVKKGRMDLKVGLATVDVTVVVEFQIGLSDSVLEYVVSIERRIQWSEDAVTIVAWVSSEVDVEGIS